MAAPADRTLPVTTWRMPGDRGTISRMGRVSSTLNRIGDGPYPTADNIVNRAVRNGTENLMHSFNDLFLNDMIWASSISAATILHKNKTTLLSRNRPLYHNLRRGLKDREDKEPTNKFFDAALRFSAANDVELFDHVEDLYGMVRAPKFSFGITSKVLLDRTTGRADSYSTGADC
jgi:hypothetical protein